MSSGMSFSLSFMSREASEDGGLQVVNLSTAKLSPESRAEHGGLRPFY